MVSQMKKSYPYRFATENLSQRAYDFIRDKIVDQKYRPGEPILEPSISDELGISRTPVREALKLLEKEDLVTIYPRRGAFISSISLEKVREIYQLREIIEGEVARLVASSISEDSLSKIEEKLQAVKEKVDQHGDRNIDKAVRVGRELHNLILETLGNKTLIEILNKIKFDAQRGCDFASEKADNVLIFLDQHLEIIKALKERDGEKAKSLLNKHVKDARESII